MHIHAAKWMKTRRVCAVVLALTLVFISFFVFPSPARAETDGMIRVRLTRLGVPNAVTLVADCDYYLASDPTLRIGADERATVSAEGDQLVLSVGKRRAELGTTARLIRGGSGKQGVRFLQPELSNRFCGDLGFSASGGVIGTILNIFVEDYLYGVVGYEMPPSSGLEALKAQAVAARTYVLRKKATRGSAAYDVTDTTADQVFRGYSAASDYANVVKAVDKTRGAVLYSGNALAQCYYCASNGGQTESTANAWGTSLSYSVVQDDPYDLESSGTVRTATINKDLSGLNGALKQALIDDLTAQLEAKGIDPADVHVDGIESVTACDSRYASPSRVYRSLTFKLALTGTVGGESRTGSLSVSIPTYGAFEEWYGLSINPEDNETVWVTETERAFNVSFRRFGHGVGMSQRGAQVMASAYGMSAGEILKFYYPGTTGKILELSDSARSESAATPRPEQTPVATARLSDRTDLHSAPEGAASVTATAAAGAVVDVYGVQGDWAAVGFGGKYGYIPSDRLESYTPKDSTVVWPEQATYAVALREEAVLQLPAAHANAMDTMKSGSDMQVFAWSGEWALVETDNGFMGYVPLDAIRIEKREEEPAATPAPEAQEDDGIIVAASDLFGQLRQDSPLYIAGSDLSESDQVLYLGTLVKVLSYNQDWARVRTQDGQEGFLPLRCIQALSSASEAEGSQEDAVDGTVRHVNGTRYLYVKEEQAAVYASWSTGAEVIGTLSAGERVRLGAYNDRWACVRLPDGGATGYMLRTSLTTEPPAEAVEGGQTVRAPSGTFAVAVRAGAPVYRSYAEDSGRIAELDQGEQVEVIAYNAAWVMVRFDGLVGYVRIGDLKLER